MDRTFDETPAMRRTGKIAIDPGDCGHGAFDLILSERRHLGQPCFGNLLE
jgi:hypothetical protein